MRLISKWTGFTGAKTGQGTPDEELFARLDVALSATESWVLDGNYNRTRQALWPGTGNQESFRLSFFSQDSIIHWAPKTWHKNRLWYLADMQDPQFAGLTFVRLRTRAETEDFIAKIRLSATIDS